MIIANESKIKKHLKLLYDLERIHNNMDYMPCVREAALENLLVVHARLQHLGINIELIDMSKKEKEN